MTTHQFAFTVVMITALTPALAHAVPERASAKACADAFATSIATHGAQVPVYKLSFHGGTESVLGDFYSLARTFELEARDPKTGSAIARAVCTTDYRGSVKEISAVPLSAGPLIGGSEF